MANLTIQKLGLDGLEATFSAADGTGDSFKNDGKTYLHVKNADTVSHTVTVDSTQKCSHGFDHDASVTVAAGGEKQIGPFMVTRFNDENANVNVSYDAVTSLTVAAIKL